MILLVVEAALQNRFSARETIENATHGEHCPDDLFSLTPCFHLVAKPDHKPKQQREVCIQGVWL